MRWTVISIKKKRRNFSLIISSLCLLFVCLHVDTFGFSLIRLAMVIACMSIDVNRIQSVDFKLTHYSIVAANNNYVYVPNGKFAPIHVMFTLMFHFFIIFFSFSRVYFCILFMWFHFNFNFNFVFIFLQHVFFSVDFELDTIPSMCMSIFMWMLLVNNDRMRGKKHENGTYETICECKRNQQRVLYTHEHAKLAKEDLL